MHLIVVRQVDKATDSRVQVPGPVRLCFLCQRMFRRLVPIIMYPSAQQGRGKNYLKSGPHDDNGQGSSETGPNTFKSLLYLYVTFTLFMLICLCGHETNADQFPYLRQFALMALNIATRHRVYYSHFIFRVPGGIEIYTITDCVRHRW